VLVLYVGDSQESKDESFDSALVEASQTSAQSESRPSPTGLLGDLPNIEKHRHGTAEKQLESKATKQKGQKSKKKERKEPEAPADMPRTFLCELTKKPMSDPVRSIYGNVFDKPTILSWFVNQGRICPLTGTTSLTPNY
jgi:hypothetical protein